MKKILLLGAMFLVLKTSIVHSQNLLQNGNFQNSYPCCNTSSGIANTCPLNSTTGYSNCLGYNNSTGWTSIFGYPYVMWEGDNPVTIPAGNTNYYLNLYALGGGSGSPGIYAGYNNITFTAGSSYTITYRRRGNTTNGDYMHIIIGTISVGQDLGSDVFSTISSWQTNSISFTASSTYTGILFGGGFNLAPNIDIDDIVITNTSGDHGCCNPYYTYTSADLPLPAFDKRAIYITTSGNGVYVTPNTNTTFQAGQYIQLNPGFETQTNSNFLAYIAPCTTNAPVANAGIDVSKQWNDPNHCATIGVTPEYGVTYSWTSSTPVAAETWPSPGFGVLHPPSYYALSFSSSSIANPSVCYTLHDAYGVQVTNTVTASNSCGTSTSDAMTYTYYLCYGCRRADFGYPLEDNNIDVLSYPNPTTGKIRLEIPTEASSVNVTIDDLRGTRIYESNLAGSQEIDLSGRESGLYILKTNIDGEVKTQKIILNK